MKRLLILSLFLQACSASSQDPSPPKVCFAPARGAPPCASSPLESCARSPMCGDNPCQGFAQTDGGVYEGVCQ
jgi:hypothetical protein